MKTTLEAIGKWVICTISTIVIGFSILLILSIERVEASQITIDIPGFHMSVGDREVGVRVHGVGVMVGERHHKPFPPRHYREHHRYKYDRPPRHYRPHRSEHHRYKYDRLPRQYPHGGPYGRSPRR